MNMRLHIARKARGCAAITGDCGFMMAFHMIARRAAQVSLVLVHNPGRGSQNLGLLELY